MRTFTIVVLGLIMAGCAAKPEPPYQVTKVADGLKFPEGPAWDGRGNLYVSNCDADPGIVTKVDEKGNASVAFTGSDKTFKKTNGNLYFSDPAGSSKEAPIGRVYRVDKLKKVTQVASGLAFPNGIAFSADGNTLYVAESNKYQVLKYPVKSDGSLGEKSVFCTLPGEHDPDGMNFDSAGNLWVAQFGGGAVHEFDPSGKLI